MFFKISLFLSFSLSVIVQSMSGRYISSHLASTPSSQLKKTSHAERRKKKEEVEGEVREEKKRRN